MLRKMPPCPFFRASRLVPCVLRRFPAVPAGARSVLPSAAASAMTPQSVLTFSREALTLLLAISLPVLLSVLAVGLVVSIFQAVTQINENTLSFVPKLVAAVVVFAVAGPWMLATVVDFIRRTIESIPLAVG